MASSDPQPPYPAEAGPGGGATFVVDAAGSIESWSEAAEQVYGHRAADIVGRPAAVLEAPHHAGHLLRRAAACAGAITGFQSEHVRADGVTTVVDVSAAPSRGRDGEILRIACRVRELPDRRTGDPELQRLSDAVRHGSDAVISLDREGRAVASSKKFRVKFER